MQLQEPVQCFLVVRKSAEVRRRIRLVAGRLGQAEFPVNQLDGSSRIGHGQAVEILLDGRRLAAFPSGDELVKDRQHFHRMMRIGFGSRPQHRRPRT